MPRGRTVSAPAGMVCHLKGLDTRSENQAGRVRTLARKVSAESIDSSLPPVTPQDDICYEHGLVEGNEQFFSLFKETKNRNSSKRYGYVAGIDKPKRSSCVRGNIFGVLLYSNSIQ